MAIRYIADSYAWLAYFNKNRFNSIIENEIIETPSIAVAEISRVLWRKKLDKLTVEKFLNFISERGIILNLDFETAKKGGEISENEKLSLADGLIYAYVAGENCRLITGDEHFKGKKNVIFEKE
jgi:predicted nucleic acid-binding protein